jgi:ribosomal protein S6
MFIFTDAVKTDDVDAAITAVREEIEKLGGEVEYNTRLGKRTFARPLRKQDAGQYAVVTFAFDGARIAELRSRYKLMEQVLRVQFMKLQEKEAVAASDGASNG